MIYPPVDELLKKVDCRYTLVVETAKRARQLVEGAPSLVDTENKKPVSVAVREIYDDKVKYERHTDFSR